MTQAQWLEGKLASSETVAARAWCAVRQLDTWIASAEVTLNQARQPGGLSRFLSWDQAEAAGR